jgi:lipoprotein-releasing system permease protein
LNSTLLKLSFSYIFNFKKDKAFSISTILSSTALVLGISILITVMSVMNGFREELIDSLSGINGDLTIYDIADDKLLELTNTYPGMSFVKNYQERVITSNNSSIEGLLMKSISQSDIYVIPKIQQSLFELNGIDENWVYIGVELAKSLNIKAGEVISINIPGSSMTILGPVLNSYELSVKGIFNTGIYDYDKYFIYSDINSFNNINSKPIVDVYLNGQKFNFDDLQNYYYETWADQNKSLAQALTTEKNVMFIILFFIVIISSFTIISNQIFFIKEKFKDIVLLKVLGVRQLDIAILFFLNSFIISLFSIILGTALGVFLSINIDSVENILSGLLNFELWNNEIRYLATMPYSIKISDITFIVTVSLIATLVSSYIPILRIFNNSK